MLVAQLDDLCIYHWLFVLIIQSQHPINRETGYSNVLGHDQLISQVQWYSATRAHPTNSRIWAFTTNRTANYLPGNFSQSSRMYFPHSTRATLTFNSHCFRAISGCQVKVLRENHSTVLPLQRGWNTKGSRCFNLLVSVKGAAF